MSEARSIQTRRTMWPRMSMPRILPAWVRTSSTLAANWMPPALPLPPTWTWALTTTGYPMRSATATAPSAVSATSPAETGMPKRAKYCLPWYSKRSMGSGSLPVALGQRDPQPLHDRAHARSWGEHLGDADLLQLRDVGRRDDAAAEHDHLPGPRFAQAVDHLGEQGHVGAGEEGESDRVGVLLDGRGHDLFGRLMETGVDDL